MTAYVQKTGEYPEWEFCTFYITNLGRSWDQYTGIQYRYVNNTTGYNSPWTDAPVSLGYWDGSWGYTTEFSISLTPGYTYSVYTRMRVGTVWYEGSPEPETFYFSPTVVETSNPPSISSGGAFNNTITINVNPNGSFNQIQIEMWTIDATALLSTKTQGDTGGASFSVTFGGLVENASYLFRARALRGATMSDWGGWLTVKNDMSRPNSWAWITARDGLGHKLTSADFSMLASEWNSFTSRINDFRKYKELPTKTFTTVYSGSDFMFYIFNEAMFAIDDMMTTPVSQKTTGDIVYAMDFNALMDALNYN